nr:T9SS type A sorting domain-containing protein [Candidatus Cloacimonadota bacterium]
KKVSSEANYDYLRFYIDNQLIDEWSGEVGWSEENYNVSVGEHTFTWTYFKDQGVVGGDDCAWIDYITFPVIMMNVSSQEQILPSITKLLGNYPNPFNPTTTISFSLIAKDAKIEIYNLKGQKVKTFSNLQITQSINQKIIWNGEDDNGKPVSSGIYFYKLRTAGFEDTKKMILMK